MHLVAGRVAQEYNQRKNRSGAFWEDRYHASAVMHDDYLLKCMIYIDLNMNRAEVVSHPRDYLYAGHNEILNPKRRYSIIDREGLKNYCGFNNMDNFISHFKTLINGACYNRSGIKDEKWSESIAASDERYIQEVMEKLSSKVKSRVVIMDGDRFVLKEPGHSYITNFNGKNGGLSLDNRVFWGVS